MTVSVEPHNNRQYKKLNEYLFIFENSENMISGILFLYRLNINNKCMIYKTETDYRLIIKSKNLKPCFITLYEFCKQKSRTIFDIEFTKEYGKLLLSENTIKTIGKYFSKGT